MKPLFTLYLGLILLLTSCGSQTYLSSDTLKKIIDQEEFTFMARRANPTNMDVIQVMNSFPAAGSSRMLNLDYGYTLTIKDKKVEVTLPYFGRRYNSSYDNSKNSFRFTSKDYRLSKTMNDKGKYLIIIEPHDVPEIRTMNLEIFPNGNAFLSIGPNDRQPISYDGYLMVNEVDKK